jgi:NAD(P)-dependent dehydrogenase (short-subunit alcohol dehydrogenase family)
MRLKGKSAIITGSGSGIGEASAKLFAAEGARVAVVDSDEQAAQRVAEEIGENAFSVAADVTNSAHMERMTDAAMEHFGHIDILFNNAGVSCVGTLH